MWVVLLSMQQKNNPRRLLLNADVLSFSVNEVEDMLNLDSAPNAVYNDRTIVFHLLTASTSQTSVNHVSDLCVDAHFRRNNKVSAS